MLTEPIRYTILAASASAVGPLLASYIVEYSPGSWVDYVWVCAGLAGANAIAIYLFYPESNFCRLEELQRDDPTTATQVIKGETEKEGINRVDTLSRHQVNVIEMPWMRIWSTFVTIDHDLSILEVFVRPFLMLFRPAVLLAVYIYGTSLASQVILM